MKMLLTSVFLTLTLVINAFASTIPQPNKRPTKLAQYQMSTHLGADGRLNVYVDKQLGGTVSIQLMDQKGNLYFDRTLYAVDTMARYRFDLSDLTEGTYTLKVSNGLEMIIREVKISLPSPTPVTRSITILQ